MPAHHHSVSGPRTLDFFLDGRQRRIGLDFLGRSVTRAAVGDEASAGLDTHRHDAWEITWMRSGCVSWWSQDAAFELGPGWCHITAPGTRHGSCSGLLEPGELWWMQVDPRRLRWLAPAALAALERGLAGLPAAFRGGGMLGLWQDLFDAVVEMPLRPGGPLADLAAQACLQRLLLRVLAGPSERTLSPRLVRAMRRADEGRASVAALARAAGCSAATLHRLFRDEIGDTPASWLQQRRLQEARRRLRSGREEMTAIALALGFRSSQHFATRFRELTGLTPTRYRELAAGSSRSSARSGPQDGR